MKLELNAEYRFNIFSVFKGAAFIDMGNVWTVVRPAEPSDDLKRFNFGDFWGELGLGAGLGLRLDFSYFVLRFDVATPLHNPSRPKGKRWLWNDFDVKDSKWRQQNFLLNSNWIPVLAFSVAYALASRTMAAATRSRRRWAALMAKPVTITKLPIQRTLIYGNTMAFMMIKSSGCLRSMTDSLILPC
ncbi:MAG: BamA/TamA family outer membrane protein [Sphingobacteriales bacterium]|nr:BamA/TamA family outer membrane protein [Sphingobacteriales bacterium]